MNMCLIAIVNYDEAILAQVESIQKEVSSFIYVQLNTIDALLTFDSCVHKIPYNGNNPRKKMFANWQSFLIHEKMFANGAKPSRIYSFSGTYIAARHAHFSNKGCHCRSPTKQHQCSSYSGHTHLQLLNHVILTKHSNTAVEYSARAYDCYSKNFNHLICAGTLTEVRRTSVRSLHYV